MDLELSWLLLVALLASGLSGALLLRRARTHMCSECGHGQSGHRVDGHRCDALIGDLVSCGCERFTSSSVTGSRISKTGNMRDSASPTPAPDVPGQERRTA